MAELTSFDDWYRRDYSSVLAAVALCCLDERQTAEDATNEAFVAALEDWHSVSKMEAPTAWVVKVATNIARRTFRRRSRRIELLNSERLDLFANDPQRDLDLWEKLQSLSFRQREAVSYTHLTLPTTPYV